MPHLMRDLFYSVRSLARSGGLAATIILTVGVGLGATTVMVSVIRAVLLTPLPYANADELVWIYTDNPPFRFRFSVVDYRALETDHPTFSAVAGYQSNTVTLNEGDVAERVTVKSVTGSYFSLLGQRPALGRLFGPQDDTTGERIAVLTEAFWTRRYARDATIVGRTISLNGESHAVVGVLEASSGPLERSVAAFTAERWPAPRRKGPFFTMAIARLRPDVSRQAAVDALRATNARLFPLWKSSYQDEKATWGMQDLKTRVVGDVGTTLWLVLGAVACVLLIACANAMNLLIARALDRRREFAIRSSLGASRARLLQHLLVEGGVLTVGAALVAVAVAALGINLVSTHGAGYIPRLDEVRLGGPALMWLVGLTLVSGLLICLGGLAPALRAGRGKMDQALRSGSRASSDGPAARRLRRALVVVEFALATPLIVGAALVTASLDRLGNIPVGFDTSRIFTGEVALSGPKYADESTRSAFWKSALERVSVLPGVESAALSDSRPPRGAGQTNNFDLEDRPTRAGENQPLSTWVGVSPRFFSTVGLPLESGRLFDDRSLSDNVIVVDRAWADRFFPGEEVLGRRLKGGGCSECPWTTIVGVVGTVKYTGLDASDEGTVYFPLVDLPNAYFVLRTTGDPAAMAPTMARTVRELDAGLALSGIATGDELVSEALSAPRRLSVVVGIFALSALLLSIVGVYGVMAYFVQQHTRDIGVRLALGGEPGAIGWMVILQGLRLVTVGIVAGTALALFGARYVEALLFGISAMDLRVVIGVPVVLLTIAAIACAVPGRRAARLDPAVILREG